MSDGEVLRHAAAMGRAARKVGESEERLRSLWRAWCEARDVDVAAAAVGLDVALEAFTGGAAAN